MKDLKQKAIRGGLARLSAQCVGFALRVGSLAILARLLNPKDFGLVGMVTAFTTVLSLFRDFGLSSAAVQRATVTDEQISTLFWINLAVGAFLALVAAAMAPVVAAFYHEPRLLAVTLVVAVGFLFNAAGTQHSVLLVRQMRFTALAVIGVISLTVGTAIGIGGAKAGYGYWALVAMTVALPGVSTICLWLTTRWVPGMPRRRIGIRSMMRFGITLTVNGLIVYVATNFEKVLLGRYWGADAIGLYGRAYQLINIPTDNLNSVAGEMAFSGLSRLQNDPLRLKSYFLKGCSLITGMTMPITVACAFFADDLILVLLGPKWKAAVPLFRLLAPTVLVFGIANPLSWLLTSTGHVGRLVKMDLVIAPIMIASYFVGLPHGPKGVALAYSTVMVLWVVPLIAWVTLDTLVSFRDVLLTMTWPLASSVVAGVVALAVRTMWGQSFAALLRLVVEVAVLLITSYTMLWFVAGQKTLYLDLFLQLKRRSPAENESLVSA